MSSEGKQKTWKAVAGSYALIGLLAIVLFDLSARATYGYWAPDRYSFPNRSWIWWATQDFEDTANKIDVALMGSSLMMAIVHGGDAQYLKQPQSVAMHHRSYYLQKLLSDKLQTPVKTFSLAVGGQMVSDAYAITSTLLQGDKKPRTLVYGIAPRDFMDNALGSPANTETFRYMDKVGDLSDVQMVARPTIWDKAEWVLGRVSFLYGHRAEFVYIENNITRDALASLRHENMETVHAPTKIRDIALSGLPEDAASDELMIFPTPVTAKPSFADNLPEYRARYHAFKRNAFNVQVGFFDRMLKYCDDQGINVVLVHMPLTLDNMGIMPPGLYDNYRASVQKVASAHHAKIIDLNDHKLFPKSLFADSVHLNGFGGQLFCQVLADKLVNESLVASDNRSVIK